MGVKYTFLHVRANENVYEKSPGLEPVDHDCTFYTKNTSRLKIIYKYIIYYKKKKKMPLVRVSHQKALK